VVEKVVVVELVVVELVVVELVVVELVVVWLVVVYPDGDVDAADRLEEAVVLVVVYASGRDELMAEDVLLELV